MGYPTNEFFKNSQESFRNRELPRSPAAIYGDHVYHGVIRSIHTASDCAQTYLVVCPFQPQTPDADGNLEFAQLDVHPLNSALVTNDTRYDKVYPINMPQELVGLYYSVGETITYWRYFGTEAQSDIIRGHYVTELQDLSFDALIEFVDCKAPIPICPEGRTVYPLTLPSGQIAFHYRFTAYKFNPAGVNLNERFLPYTCGNLGYAFTGDCYNFNELLNAFNTTQGNGLTTDDNDEVVDQCCDSLKLVPLGDFIGRVRPYLNPDPNACPIWEYYFDSQPNQIADEEVCSSQSGSSSGSCTDVCWYTWSTFYDCATGGFEAPTYQSYCSPSGTSPFDADPIGAWINKGITVGGLCEWQYHQRTNDPCCTPGTCIDPPAYPGNPDGGDACCSSSGSSGSGSGSAGSDCVQIPTNFQITCNEDGTFTVTPLDLVWVRRC